MGGKILLADDSVTIQKVVELTFAETDYQVVALGSGTELLERLPQERPDLVLCDVVMPDISGYEVCQRIKSDPATLHLPVVLLTGTFEPFDRDRALAAGCDAIVTKPFEARSLIATVDELMAKAPQPPQPASEGELEGLGIPEGVPVLDFTTTGFDRMVPPPEPPPAPPDHGLELTASSMQSAVSIPPSPPPELQGAGEEPFFQEPLPETAASTPPWQAQEPLAAELPASAQEAAFAVSTPAPPQVGEAAKVVPEEPASPPAPPILPEEEVETVPPGEFPEEPVAGVGGSGWDMEAVVERVVGEVLQRLPVPSSPTVEPSSGLSNDDLERVARRVLELAQPMLERIAWEIIPDMAEMLVRQRIAELEAAAEES